MGESVTYKIGFLVSGEPDLNRVSTTLDKISNKRVKDPLRDLPKSLAQLRTDLSRYKTQQESSFRTDHIRKYNNLIEATQRKIKNLELATGTAGVKAGSFFEKLRNNFGISPGMLTGGALVMMARQIGAMGMEAVKASAQFETYGVTLKTMLGSTGAARERMAEYADIARSTPFELRQVVEAGNQLQAIGRYSRENLTMLGDLAAASGKPIDQVMNAYAKLSTGQKGESVNMFRDLLISNDDWIAATGKGVKANGELMASTEEMIAALPKIMGKKGFMGMMEQQAKTTQGRMSNLSDSVDMLKVAVGDRLKPAFDSFLKSSTGLVSSMTEMISVPVSTKIAQEKAELNALVSVITDTNTSENDRLDLLKRLKAEYPEFLVNIDTETVKNDELLTKLNEVNQAYEDKIRLANIKTIKDEGQSELDALKAKKEELYLLRESFGNFTQLEEYFGKSGYEKARSKAGGHGQTFSDYLAMTAGKKEQDYLETQDPATLDWLVKYREYSGMQQQVKEHGGFYQAQNNVDEKIKKLEGEININQAYVSATDKKQQELEHQTLLKQAKGIDVGNKDVFTKLFGKKEIAGEFEQLRNKGLADFGSLQQEEWGKLADFMGGKMLYKKPVSGRPDNPNGTLGGEGVTDLETATNTITGGGREVKNFIINMNSGLIAENNNYFEPGQGPDEAEDFMTKLKTALQIVLNDTNYAI